MSFYHRKKSKWATSEAEGHSFTTNGYFFLGSIESLENYMPFLLRPSDHWLGRILYEMYSVFIFLEETKARFFVYFQFSARNTVITQQRVNEQLNNSLTRGDWFISRNGNIIMVLCVCIHTMSSSSLYLNQLRWIVTSSRSWASKIG